MGKKRESEKFATNLITDDNRARRVKLQRSVRQSQKLSSTSRLSLIIEGCNVEGERDSSSHQRQEYEADCAVEAE